MARTTTEEVKEKLDIVQDNLINALGIIDNIENVIKDSADTKYQLDGLVTKDDVRKQILLFKNKIRDVKIEIDRILNPKMIK